MSRLRTALALYLGIMLVQFAIVVLAYAIVILVWLLRWAWYGSHSLIERRRQSREEPSPAALDPPA